MDNDLVESISKMAVNGNRLELPQDEHFSNYPLVKKTLVKAGGKYKKGGFVFDGKDPGEVKQKLCGGEVINDKKEFQFFATPHKLAYRLVEMAEVTPSHKWLEPSAGRGAISDILREISEDGTVVELMPENAQILKDKGYKNSIYGDFLSQKGISGFDRIVANPPFTKNQDIDHIKHMYMLLADGGVLVSVSSLSWKLGSQSKQIEFSTWLDEIGAEVEELPRGTFKESGTQVGALIIKITK